MKRIRFVDSGPVICDIIKPAAPAGWEGTFFVAAGFEGLIVLGKRGEG